MPRKNTHKPKYSNRKPGNSKQKAGKGIATCKDAIPKELMVYCEHKVGKNKSKRFYDPGSKSIQITQTCKKDTVIIYCEQENLPTTLTVKRDGKEIEKIRGKSIGNGKEYSFGAQYYPDEDPYDFTAPNLIAIATCDKPPTIYTVEGLNAGTITVEAYMPDQWLVSLNFPPFDKVSTGRVLDNSSGTSVQIDGDTVITEKRVNKSSDFEFKREGWNQETELKVAKSYEAYSAQIKSPTLYDYSSDETWTLSASVEQKNLTGGDFAKNTFKSITIQRNGKPETFDAVQIIMSTIAVAKSIYDIYDEVANKAPKIGWFAKVEVAVLAGSIEVAWGWREHTDHRVYYHRGFSAKIDLFNVKMVLGFGLDSEHVKAQICAEINGAVTLQTGIETNGPDAGNTSITIGELEQNIEGGFYARVVVGSFVNAEAGATTGITGNIKLVYDFTQGISLTGESMWTGIKAVFKVSLYFGMCTTNKEYTIANEKLLKPTLEWPKKPETVRDLTKYEIEKTVIEELEAGWEVRFFLQFEYQETVTSAFFDDTKETVYEDAQLETAQIAKFISSKIWKRKDTISLSQKSIEGICQTLRKKMDLIGNRMFRNWVDFDEFKDYVDGDEFSTVLDQANDPGKTYLKK